MISHKELENRMGYRLLKAIFIIISFVILGLLVIVHNDDILSVKDGVIGWIVLVIVYKILIYIFFGKKTEK
jgi:hypothetical protein